SLRPGSAERAQLAAGAIGVRAFDPATGVRSNTVTVAQPGAVAPQISNAGAGCDDNFCLWLVTGGLQPPAAGDVFDLGGALLGTYRGTDLTLDTSNGVITLALKNGSPERTLFATAPLQVRVRNVSSGLSSNLYTVTRP